MATYETAWEEVEKAMSAHREASAKTRGDEDRGTPLIQPVTVGVFRRKGGEFNAAAKPALGILLVLSNCKDTHDEKEFNRWYEDVHIPDILDTGAFPHRLQVREHRSGGNQGQVPGHLRD